MAIFSAVYLHCLHQTFPSFSFPLSFSALLSRYVSFLFSLCFLSSFLSSLSSYFPFLLSTFYTSSQHQQFKHVNFVQPLVNGRNKIRYTVLCTKALSFKLYSRIVVCLSSISQLLCDVLVRGIHRPRGQAMNLWNPTA